MRKIYQSQWHGIELVSLMKEAGDYSRPPGPNFYAAFYRAFYNRYDAPELLASEWRKLKRTAAAELSRHWIPSKNARILSIGCGMGIIELDLRQQGFHKLEVTEVCNEALPWLRQVMPSKNIHIGHFPDCLDPEARYDLIFFCTIDYVFDTSELIHFLRMVRSHLNPGGQALLITHGLLPSNLFMRCSLALRDWISTWRRGYQKTFKDLFWGYLRSREEYAEAFKQAGYSHTEDSIRPTGTAWINYFRSGSA